MSLWSPQRLHDAIVLATTPLTVEEHAARLYDVFRRAIVGEHAFSDEGDMPDLEKLDPVVRQAWLKVADYSLRADAPAVD